MKLVKPEREWFVKISKFKKNFIIKREAEIIGSLDLIKYQNMSEWVTHVNASDNKDLSDRQSLYIAVSDNGQKVLGVVTIKLQLADESGNIKFSIDPTLRNQGFGNSLLKKALIMAKTIGMEEVIVSIPSDNEYALRVARHNKCDYIGEGFYKNQYIKKFSFNTNMI